MDSSSSDVKLQYPCPSTVNFANFVTVKPSLEGDDERSNFKIWKKQMHCLLESQGVLGFVDGRITQPPANDSGEDHERKEAWRRTDGLIQGWILGSIGKDVLDKVWEKETAMDVWLELGKIFSTDEKEKEKEEEDSNKSVDLSRYLPLYVAAQRDEWDLAKTLFPDMKELCTSIISSKSETALHVAVSTGKANNFVKKLVALTPREDLVSKDCNGDTALHIAAEVGNTEAAIDLIEKNPDLLNVLNKYNRLPVQKAVINCQKKTLTYLISKYDPTKEDNPLIINKTEGLGIRLLVGAIVSEFIDVALELAEKYPDLALQTTTGSSALSTIAEMHALFPRTEYFTWWQRFIYQGIPVKKTKGEGANTTFVGVVVAGDNENSSGEPSPAHQKHSTASQTVISGVRKKLESMMWNIIEHLVPSVKKLRIKKLRRDRALELAKFLCKKLKSSPGNEASDIFKTSIINAARCGNSEIVQLIMHEYPEITLDVSDENGMNIFMLAARNRFENVYNLIYNMSHRKYMVFDCTDNDGNNLMHLCGQLAPPDRLNLVSGAALQMQRELQWFKEMENFVHPSRRLWTNNDGKSPRILFTKAHGDLKEKGEIWMKDTANACTIAAALIATVMFAAVFTIPGGIDSNGDPFFKNRFSLNLFAISDAISLFTSITSLLMFLSILTSRYAEEDFLYALPKRLGMGLISLFVSITFMMVTFSATFYLVFRHEEGGAWFVLLMAAMASLPAGSFVLLQFPLLVDVIYSTYGPGIFGKKKGRLILY